MAINTLATATLFQKTLDKAAVREAVTGWMDGNAGQVKYSGGAEIKIPKMSVQGLADYDRDNGYQQGGVTLEYETRKMTQDRGRMFQLDPMDVDENNFVTTAAAVMGEFQRTFVIPEIDAYRISKIATETITAKKAGMIEYGYTPGAASTSALRKLKEGIKAVRDLYNGPLVCHATPDFIMYSAIKILDGKTVGQEIGGYNKGDAAKDLNFFICPRTTPIAVTKQDVMRIFDPMTNQKLNAWQMDYRRFHDIWVLDNKLDSIFLNIKDAEG